MAALRSPARWLGAPALLPLLLALATQPAPAAPPLADSRCATGDLVDAAFRDAALAALDRLRVRAPGGAADGAVRSHHSAGFVDAQAQAWHQVSAYQVNLGLIGALRVSPAVLPMVEDWLQWQARHIAPTGAQRGVVLDHWVRAGTLAESTCPPGIEARLCGHVDAYDSTAASTLLMADAYHRHGGRTALLREPAMRAALEAAAAMLGELTTAEGLTLAMPGHRVAYTMDAVEVIAGWRAWSRLQRDVYAEPAAAVNTLDRAGRAQAALDARLWDGARGRWRVIADGLADGGSYGGADGSSDGAADAAAPQRGRWYPDTVAQAWPLLWGHLPARRLRDGAAWQRAIAPWQLPRSHWADRVADPAGFLWPAAAVAAFCSGDTPAAQRWVARTRQRWMNPQDPFAWPFQVGDLLWLLWLAEPALSPPQPG